MSLREWLIAIGTLVIIGIVVDGIRRMRRARKESSAISSGMGADELQNSPLDEHFNPELPSGGARTIPRDELEGDRASRKKPRSVPTAPKPTRPVIASGRHKGSEPSVSAESSATDQPFAHSDEMSSQSSDHNEFAGEPLVGADDQWEPDHFSATDITSDSSAHDDFDADRFNANQAAELKQEREHEPAKVESPRPTAKPARRDPSEPLAGANRPPAKEVIVINVLARSEDEFQGPALQRLLEACGLQYGDMDIYHRHEQTDTTSPVQFSVASAVEPGTFKPEEIAGLRTPGISFFMSLPGPSNAMQAFNFMYETAQAVVRNLGGELKDERRSVMTAQTAEHCRQRIREFERKQRSQRD